MRPSHFSYRRSGSVAQFLCATIALCALLSTARAQFSYSEDFKNATAPGWVLNPAGNSTPGTVLTSGAAPRSGDPETGTIDPSGSGWLRLTNNSLNLANAVYFDTPIPSAGNSVTIAFGANFWGGNNYASTGADGITFFLYDASKTFNVGSSGGAIGYAQGLGVDPNGLNGGYVGVAFDPYGNFSTTTEGRQGGPGTALQPNTVVVRGPGQDTSGYNYLAGTGYRDFTDTGSPTTLDGGDGTVPAVPYTMAFPTATARPNQSTQYRNISVTINESSQLSVSMQFGEDGLWYQLLDVDLSSFVRPEQLKMGFAAGTGAGTLITEVGGLLTIQATAGTGNFIWDNRNGPGDSGGGNSVWGTGATDPLNWAGQTNPTLKSNVIFNSTYVGSTQNISVDGSDKVITNMYFSGANSYNLSTSEARKLIFDSNTVDGLTAINLTNDAGGNSAHTIGLDVQMNKNLDINNNISRPSRSAAISTPVAISSASRAPAPPSSPAPSAAPAPSRKAMPAPPALSAPVRIPIPATPPSSPAPSKSKKPRPLAALPPAPSSIPAAPSPSPAPAPPSPPRASRSAATASATPARSAMSPAPTPGPAPSPSAPPAATPSASTPAVSISPASSPAPPATTSRKWATARSPSPAPTPSAAAPPSTPARFRSPPTTTSAPLPARPRPDISPSTAALSKTPRQ